MNNKPKLRFPEFTDDWEQRKLGEVAKYRNGKAHENDIDDNGKYIVVNSKFVSTDGEVKKYSNTQIEPLMKDEIAFVLSDVPNGRAIARTFLVDESDKYTLNQRIAGITPLEKTYPYFLHILMNRNRYFLSFDDGAKQTNLSVADVMNFEEMYPAYDEQKKIGDYFNNLDNLITLHQCKLDNIKLYKTGMLQKMFPKEGKDIPEVRFPGFTDAWERCKFGELYKVNNERNKSLIGYDRTFSIATMTYKNEGNGAADSSLENYKVLRVGDVAFEGHTNKEFRYGRFVVNDVGDGIMSPRFSTLRPINKMPVSFWKYYIHYEPIMRNIVICSTKAGTMMNELVSSDFFAQDILVPSNEEQSQIGGFLAGLDNLITLHLRKLDELKEYKQGLLQQMFA